MIINIKKKSTIIKIILLGCPIIILIFIILLIFYFKNIATTESVDNSFTSTPQNALIFARRVKSYYIKPSISQKLQKNFLQKYFAPWHTNQLLIPIKDIKQIEQQVIAKYIKNPGWGDNRHKNSVLWLNSS